MVTITSVRRGSPADKKKLKAGDVLLSINGNEIKDVLDYQFYITEPSLTLLIHRGPELLTVRLRKSEYEDPGLEFETFLMDKQRTCKNKCVFCFIDQNPKGMRDSIYFKDDDSRMSFLMGSYVTLTNMTDADVDRILAMHISPLHISVHTTDPDLRVKMMKNPNAGRVLSYLRRFADAGIDLECQIVLCKGWNDKEHLDRTMRDLCTYLPSVGICAIVPCGVTCYRQKLPLLEPFTGEECAAVLDQVAVFQKQCEEAYGRPVFYCSDEFYLKAGRPFPAGSFYDDYAQIENGVGMIPSMRDEFEECIGDLTEDDRAVCREVSVATGAAAFPFLEGLAKRLTEQVPGLRIHTYCIRNDFFGETITVAGLVTGGDLMKQLEHQPLGEVLYLPSVMLRHEGDLFLDDKSLDEVSAFLKTEIRVIDTTDGGYGYTDAMLNRL